MAIVRDSGLEYTLVRAAWFAQNFSEGALFGQVLAGVVAMPADNIREPFIDVEDIADVEQLKAKVAWLRETSGGRPIGIKLAAGHIEADLEAALAGDTPAQSVMKVMRETPEGKDRWYLYLSDCLHELIDEWLKKNEITPTDDPPWAESAD